MSYQFGKLNIEKKEIESTVLNVPFKMKNEAKELGALWNKDLKKWYVKKDNINYEKMIETFNANEEVKKDVVDKNEICTVRVPFAYKNYAKEMGIKYSKKYGSYINKNHPDCEKLSEIFRGRNFHCLFYQTYYYGPKIKGFELPSVIDNIISFPTSER